MKYIEERYPDLAGSDQIVIQKDRGTKFSKDTRWARDRLVWEGLISGSGDGVWALTTEGVNAVMTPERAADIERRFQAHKAAVRRARATAARAPEVDDARDLVAERAGRQRTGQGFRSSTALRQAVEQHAMCLATAHYVAEGWGVDNVSKWELVRPAVLSPGWSGASGRSEGHRRRWLGDPPHAERG